jgi:alpha-amylase
MNYLFIIIIIIIILLLIFMFSKNSGSGGTGSSGPSGPSNFPVCGVYPKTPENSTFIQEYPGIKEDYHYINGYSDIIYNNDRTQATVYIKSFINETENKVVSVSYSFDNGLTYSSINYKTFNKDDSKDETLMIIKVNYENIGDKFLHLQPILFLWQVSVPQTVRDKHAIVDLFGWDYLSIYKEIDVISKAGWTGIRLFPVFEHLMYLPEFVKKNNPWYVIYQPVSYNFNSVNGSREQLQQVINKANTSNLNVYIDIIFNHTTYPSVYYKENKNSTYNTVITSGGVNYIETNKVISPSLDITKNTTFDARKWQFPGIPLYKYNFHQSEKGIGYTEDDTQCTRLTNLLDIASDSDNVLDRQSACLVELLSRGVSGFRFDAARHMTQIYVATLINKVYEKMGNYLPEYQMSWFEIYTKPTFPWEQEFNSALNPSINKDSFKFWYNWNNNFVVYTDPTTGKPTKQSMKQFDCHDNQQNGAKNSLVYTYKNNVQTYINQIVNMFKDNDGISTKLLLSSFWVDTKTKNYNFPNGFGINPDKYVSGYVNNNFTSMNTSNKSPGQFTRVHRDSQIVSAMNSFLNRK